MSWFPEFANARCRDSDPELWFPEPGKSSRPAKDICRICEEREPCLELALEHDERHGIRGGLTPNERKRLKRGAA